jgi:hypothetical protein
LKRFPQVAARLVVIAFIVGAIVHAVGFVRGLLDLVPPAPHYPPWRHALMAGADVTIASVAFRRPRALVFVLAAFLLQQIATNGRFALTEWRDGGVVHGQMIVMLCLEAAAVYLAVLIRRQPARPAQGESTSRI